MKKKKRNNKTSLHFNNENGRKIKLSSIFRFILVVMSILGCIWFLLPFFMYGILGIGNLTGIMVCLITFTFSIFYKYINKSSKTIPYRICFMIAFIIIFLTIFISIFMIIGASKKPKENATVVVLGCKVIGKTPSLTLYERLNATKKYMLDNPNSKAIVSGGQGADEIISEAEAMYTFLVNNGISPDRIIMEDKSTSTRENLLFSFDLIKKHNLSEDLAIVTNDYHEYRAITIARKLKLKAGAVPAKTAWWLLPTYYVRELYAVLWEWIV
jgi:hypothetical protein